MRQHEQPKLPRSLRRVTERLIGGNEVSLLRDGTEAFPAMLEAIDAAQRQVLLEMYWFDSDRTGQRFADALIAAAERGVEVAVTYDAVGSWGSDPRMFDRMSAHGVKVTEFNPIAPWRRRFAFSKLFRRNHRKLLVTDGQVGFTGGLNIADPWAPDEATGRVPWRDDVVRIEGPAVIGLIACFMRTWEQQDGPALEALLSPSPTGDESTSKVRILGQAFFRNRREIFRNYLYRMYLAQRKIWITNSYFVPDRLVLRALKRAAKRGVDVRVLLPGVSDVPLVRYASRACWGGLMRQGVRIYEWQANILHAKTAVIDGNWSTIGTYNLDYWSLRYNLEVNVAVEDADFGTVVEDSFRRDLELSTEVDSRSFAFRPLGSRALEMALYRLRKVL